MGIDKIKMIVMDMDGTLLNNKKQITQETCDALRHMEANGTRLVLASGRVKTRMEEYAKQLQMDTYQGYLIEANGSCIYSYENDTREILHEMSYEEADIVFRFLREHYPQNEIMIMADVNAYVYLPQGVKESSYFNTNNMESLRNREIFYINNVHEIKERFFKVCTYGEPKDVIAIGKHVQKELSHAYWSGRTMPFWLEIMPKDVSKGNALQTLMQEHGISHNEVLVFGDGENDISMLCEGCGVAMGNAIASVKEACDYETLDNEHDGIASFLKDIVKAW